MFSSVELGHCSSSLELNQRNVKQGYSPLQATQHNAAHNYKELNIVRNNFQSIREKRRGD